LDEYIRTREIDCFINNAGVYEGNVLETNLVSQVKMLQVVYDYFKEKNKGKIININSLAGINPTVGESLYCASKFGLKGFSQSLQLEAVNTGVEITDVYLGGVQTRMTKDRLSYNSLMKPDDVAMQIIDLVNTKSYYVNEITMRRRNESCAS
jgi:short-subunit dehydrogenase